MFVECGRFFWQNLDSENPRKCKLQMGGQDSLTYIDSEYMVYSCHG